MKRTAFAAVLAFAAVVSHAQPQAREYLGTSTSGTKFYFLPGRFKEVSSSVYNIWVEQVESRRQSIFEGRPKGPKYVKLLQQQQVNCKSETLQILTTVYYDKDGTTFTDQEYRPASVYIPESMGEALYMRICAEWQRP